MITGLILRRFENRVSLMPVLGGGGGARGGGARQCCTTTLLHMNRLNKSVFSASRGSSFRTYFIFTAAGVAPCGGRKTSSRTSS